MASTKSSPYPTESPRPNIATGLSLRSNSPIFSNRSSQTVPDLNSSAPVFQVGIPQIMPSRFGKCAKSPSDTSIASETASPSSFFIVPQTCSVLPV